ncbi:glycine cleavage system transcriptional repressor [Psychrosphaera aestuarii]|uniref:glycine cleavage system protein R n=1 Tax=Psychrosphaera aestuarii TaxID=1266052 RepID=UPI001B337E1B|nr:ACT domain-containing protein [Psychrosphaera aestuarii]
MTTINTAPQYLVLTAIGENKTGLVSELAGLVYQCGCNVVDSKMAIFANEFSIIMLLEGEHIDLLQLETQLPPLAMSLSLLTMMKRTQKRHLSDELTNHYLITIEGPDKAGTIKVFTSYLAEQGIDITSLRSSTDVRSGKTWQSAQIEVSLPNSESLNQFETNFLALCHSYDMECHVSPITIEVS